MSGIMMALLGSDGSSVTLNTTLTIGTAIVGGIAYRGFASGATSFGSLGSASTSDGYTVVSVYDYRDNSTPEYIAVCAISGFGTDPGQAYLYDVTANGTTKTGSTAAYTYSTGTAIWEWADSTTAPLFGFGTSGTTTLIVKKS